MLLVGERVRLREFRRSDLPHIQAWVNDPAVNRFLSFWVKPQSDAETEAFLESRLKQDPASSVDLVITLKDDPDLTYIGACGLYPDLRHRHATLGIVIGRPDLHGQGIGRDAIRTILDYGFNFLGLNKVSLALDEGNESGARCYRACGFREEGRIRERLFHDGRFWDEVHMGITRAEYLGLEDDRR